MTRKSLPRSREFSTGLCAQPHSCSTCPHILVIQQADLRECFIVNAEIHSSCIFPSMLSFSRSVFYSDLLTATTYGLNIFLMHPTSTAYLFFLCYFQLHNINTVNETTHFVIFAANSYSVPFMSKRTLCCSLTCLQNDINNCSERKLSMAICK